MNPEQLGVGCNGRQRVGIERRRQFRAFVQPIMFKVEQFFPQDRFMTGHENELFARTETRHFVRRHQFAGRETGRIRSFE